MPRRDNRLTLKTGEIVTPYQLLASEFDSIKPPRCWRAGEGWREEGLSRNHLATDSVRSKLPALSVPVSPSPVSREASRDFVALDRPLDDGRVHTANVAASTSTVSTKYNTLFNLHVQVKTKIISPTKTKHGTAEKGVSDERGRRQTAQHHKRLHQAS